MLPVGYLVPALIVLLIVYYLLAPMSWPRPLRVLPIPNTYIGWWVLSAVASELPLHAILVLSTSSMISYYEGDFLSTDGRIIAFGVHVVAAVGLLVVFFMSFKSAPVIRRALDDGLGKNWADDLDDDIVEGLNGFSPRALLGPFFRRGQGVRHIRDISYGEAGKYSSLDVYHSESMPSGGAVFIHLHGGALRSGKKDREALPLLYHLARRGWVCISANYRLQPHVGFEEQLDDVRGVVAWAKENVAEYGGDADFIMLGGGSAGGHLAAMIGLEPGQVDAVAIFYGSFFYASLEESPTTYVHEGAPPFLVMHGDHDNLVPVEGTRRFVHELESVSMNPVVYAELPNADHNFDQFNSVRNEAIIGAVEAFGVWAQKSKQKAAVHSGVA